MLNGHGEESCVNMPTLLERLKGYLETLNAIELLEYYDKNHLYFGTDPAKLSREKQELFRLARGVLEHLQRENRA